MRPPNRGPPGYGPRSDPRDDGCGYARGVSNDPRLTPNLQTMADLLESVDQDNAFLLDAAERMRAAIGRVESLNQLYSQIWLEERDAAVAAFGVEPTPRVLAEDDIWDAMGDHDQAIKELLQVLMTSSVLQPDAEACG